MGARAAQAFLPQVQLRASGRRDRRQYRAVADGGAQLRPRRRAALSALVERQGRAGPGAARCADVPGALALGGGHCAGVAAHARRQESAAADRAHECRGPDRLGVSRPARLRREPRRRARDSRPSAGAPDHRRLPERGDGFRRAAAAAHGAGERCDPRRHPRPDRAVAAGARSAVGAALCLSRRCAAGRAPHAGGDGPALARSGSRLRPRPPRPRGDRARADGSLARCRQRRRAARCAGLARLCHGGGSRRGGGMEPVARRTRCGKAHDAAARAGRPALGDRGAAAAVPRPVARRKT